VISSNTGVQLFSTCPPSSDESRADYLRRIIEVARWSDRAGYRGILVYTDNAQVDPWLISQLVLQHTTSLSPLVAVQPVYMHPYTAAKAVASLVFLHERRIYLNFVAGGFVGDLAALGDTTPHEQRYERLLEYAQIMSALLSTSDPVTFEGKHYAVTNLKMKPSVPQDLRPKLMISGSSPAGRAAARRLEATAIKYPQPHGEEIDRTDDSIESGIRIGIIARSASEEAWRVAHERFPDDRKGEITHALAMKVSDSRWHRQLSDLAEASLSVQNTYWLGPFQKHKTFCPYLVGSYGDVGSELGRYLALGFRTFILDVPISQEDLQHTARAFSAAAAEPVAS